MGYQAGKKMGPGELADFHRLPPPSSRQVHPDKQEIKQRWQETCMNEQESAQMVETQKDDPGGAAL